MSGTGNLPIVSPIQVAATGNYTGTAAVRGGGILGIFVASSTSGTIAVYDSATTTTTVPIVPVFAATGGTWYPLPFGYTQGVYIVVGGTLTAVLGLL
jgi:hypothetical protein